MNSYSWIHQFSLNWKKNKHSWILREHWVLSEGRTKSDIDDDDDDLFFDIIFNNIMGQELFSIPHIYRCISHD